ncbi:hypothetical protein D1007_08981 [Hordeum vulgare]|nr:hypothetical protein D1007_08981 [Hordeum vulgare]
MIMAPPLVVLLLLLCLAVSSRDAAALTRRDFPDGFIFGTGTLAFQVLLHPPFTLSLWKGLLQKMGGSPASGTPSPIKDLIISGTIALMSMPGYSYDKSTAVVSADQYHHYKWSVTVTPMQGKKSSP